MPKSAAAGGLDRKAIALVNLGRFDFASRELINLAIFARDKNSVGQRVLAAVEAPWRANCAFHVRVNRRRPAHAHFVRDTQAAAKFSRAPRVLAQLAMFDDDGIFRFRSFHRRVMRIAVIEADCRVHAVLVVLRAPASARVADMRPEKTSGLGIEAVRVNRAEIGVMAGNSAVGTGGRQRSKSVSQTVIGTVIHTRTGAGFVALTTRPGGRMIFSGRKEPSLIGNSSGAVTHLKTTSAAERPAVGPEL